MIIQRLQDYKEYIGTAEDNIAFNKSFGGFTKRAEQRIEELKNTSYTKIFKIKKNNI